MKQSRTFLEEATELSELMHKLFTLFCEHIGVVWLLDRLSQRKPGE